MDYWWGTIYRHIADRTRTFWWANATIAGTISVLSLIFGLFENDGVARAGAFGGAMGIGAFAVAFFVGGILTPPSEPVE